MPSLQAETRNIGTILSQKYFFRVPEYQRPFSWSADNFDDLIDDVLSANKDEEYFLGTFVLHYREDHGHFDIVDGQQRVTSLMILLACLRDLIEDEGFAADIQDKILQPKNLVDDIPEKVRLEVRDRNTFCEVVVARGGTGVERDTYGMPEPEWRYVDAVRTFRSKLEGLDQARLKQLTKFITQKCIIIFLATQTFDEAFRLFTIVNDRGKQLRRIDILKAHNISPDVVAGATIRQKLAQRWEDLENELGSDVFESSFHLVRLVILKDKPQGNLLLEFESRVFDVGKVAMGEPFLQVMFDYCSLYTSIFLDRDIVPEDSSDCLRYRALIHIMDSEFKASEWRACLLLFANRFGSNGFYRFCLSLEKVFLAHWVDGVRKDERYSEYSRILKLIEKASNSSEVLEGVVTDVAPIQAAAGRKDLYNASFGKYFLLRLELAVAEHDVLREFNAKSVEHVLPQNPAPEGYWADRHEIEDIPSYVHKIGNLVLLSKSKNSSARNRAFPEKKERYLRKRVSDYPRSVQVLDYEDWLPETIEERTTEAQQLIVEDP